MKVAITGGGGYVGSILVPHLLSLGHSITVLDTFWYGKHLEPHDNLEIITGDIRDSIALRKSFRKKEAVIHLACVSNDPSFDMNAKLGKEINYDCFRNILDIVKEQKIERFIYASSSSVYGISDAKDVTEDNPLRPLTDYSKFKVACELELKTIGTNGVWTILRPATVCGYAPRMRLDVVVNKLTIDALELKKITLFGREQKRPNINIQDMVRAYEWALVQDPMRINQKIYNVGFENLRLHEIADLVKSTIGDHSIEITERPTHDPRSYHINSNKILNDGYRPIHTVQSGIESIKKFRNRLFNPLDNADYHNIKKMKELGL